MEHTIEPPRDIDYRSIKSAINRNTLILSASKISDSFGGGLTQSFGGLGLGSSLSTPHKVVTDDAGKCVLQLINAYHLNTYCNYLTVTNTMKEKWEIQIEIAGQKSPDSLTVR